MSSSLCGVDLFNSILKIEFSGYNCFYYLLDFMLGCMSVFLFSLKLTLKGCVFVLSFPPQPPI